MKPYTFETKEIITGDEYDFSTVIYFEGTELLILDFNHQPETIVQCMNMAYTAGFNKAIITQSMIEKEFFNE